MGIKKFSENTIREIGHYVYRLVDPRNGETFYVGKGKGNRIFDHARGEIKDDEENNPKLNKINDIKRAGLSVIHIIHRHGIPKDAVDEVEATLIDSYPGLDNKVSGYGSNVRGPMNVEEIERTYSLDPIEYKKNEKLILINIPNVEDRYDVNSVLKQTQEAWVINKTRANNADYILSIHKGVCCGVFINKSGWITATTENFPNRIKDLNNSKRSGFYGERAPEEVWNRFVGKNGKLIIHKDMKHGQNPIRYFPKEY